MVHLKEWIFGGKTFCFCMPTRLGTILLSFLTLLFAGVLTVILWFEVSSTPDMTSSARTAFTVAGTVETLLLLASILGFSGSIVRKQLFVTIYAWFLYGHFFLNIAIAGYFLYEANQAGSGGFSKACQDSLHNVDEQEQCTDLLKVAKGIYIAAAAAVLLAEMYALIVVTRYLRQLRFEKRRGRARAMRVTSDSSQSNDIQKHAHHPSEDFALLSKPQPTPQTEEFDPYSEYHDRSTSMASSSTPRHVEEGYGGGNWSYEDIRRDEKRKMTAEDLAKEEDVGTQRLPSPAPLVPEPSMGPSLTELTLPRESASRTPRSSSTSHAPELPPSYVATVGTHTLTLPRAKA